MPPFRRVTDEFSVSPQITVEDVAAAADQGFVLIINNRPDGEDPAQAAGAEIEAAARAHGL
ncbi:MAG TPA: sulfur transferase domain-containing protein, partial [Phenylobacterium sp.]|nr:sulfur transferase domain-containing protein [Phenylobacterium sp.]